MSYGGALKTPGTLYGVGQWMVRTLGAAAAIAIAYFLASRLGLALRTAPLGMAVFWPASGVGAGILIISGRRATPVLVVGVVVGTVAANFVSYPKLITLLLKGFCGAGEAVLAARLLERWFGQPFEFGNLRRVLGFLAAAGLATATCAVGGAATITLFHAAAPYWDVWWAWFLSGIVGIVVVAPLIIELGQEWRKPSPLGERIEGVGILALLTLVILYVETNPSGSWLSFSPGIAVLPLLLWLAARCPPMFAIAGAFIVSATVIGATTYGVGRFGDALVPIMERVRGAQATVTTTTIFTLVLTALFAQRKKAEEELRKSEGQLAKKSAALARLHEVGSRLWVKHDLRQALDEIVVDAIELLGADMGAIRIFDAARGVLKIEAQRGFTQEFLHRFSEVALAEGGSPCCRALRSGKRIVVEDVEADTAFMAFRPLARAAGCRALQATPIMNREGMPLGTLATYFRSVHKPAEQDLHLLDLYVGQAAEIIERHRAEDALRESEERLRLAQSKTGVGIWDWNLRTGKLTWTPELEALFGLEPGTVKRYADFRSRVHPDDIAMVEAKGDVAVRDRKTFEFECRIIRADGQVRWIRASGGAFYDDVTGEPIRMLGNHVDITERKQAELQLALAGQAALVGSYAYEADLETMRVSEGYCAIHGLPAGITETTRTEFFARVHPDDRERLKSFRAQTYSDKREVYTQEFRIVRASGEVRWIESRGVISYGGDAQPRRVVGISIDVTQRKEHENHKNTLISELDHRVKNVLATVLTVASRTQETSDSMAEFVVALEGRIKSMATTHELLSHRRWQGIPLAELVRRELAPYATSDNTRIEGPDVVLSAEAGQTLAMVFHELATNAAKFGAMSSTGGCVSVRWSLVHNGRANSLLYIDWKESGGPKVAPSTRSGFGTSVVRELIPYELGGRVDYLLAPDGVVCKMEIHGAWLSGDTTRPAIHAGDGAS
jgi:PAS domain S-box-containing protein